MAETSGFISDRIVYPDTDGQPMTESDATRDYLIYCVEVLRLYFKSRPNVYVSGNLFIYYEEGNPKASVSPDVFVIFGVSQRQRRSYKAWQEGSKLPSFVLEITSRTTKRQDETEKPRLYANLGVEEYFQYDPTADYLNPQLRGSQLIDGSYQPLPVSTSSEGIPFIHSRVLGLDLQLHAPYAGLGIAPLPMALRFFDPTTGTKLLDREEVEQVREALVQENELMQQERDAAQQERDAAQQERDAARQRAEALAARLRDLGIDIDDTP
ncbi:Uma2 family endonuclease [Nodosilinea sp. PGN35]|uniref:Uma2 family endonuclease n=1 Tax=Nodosilinea sp. PGN35 TaxID=3020489 RepID=UPI0023B2B0C5|nr:Uma2 family endonuclease [Nodosilinea sp. TSF1-S3]MDF0368313.1 Uma2 family endonuclease [Nodosilinea sp. TSF1-S3]